MTERAGDENGREERIGEVLGGYLEAVEAGRAPLLAELLTRHPDLAGELAAFFAQEQRLARMVAPLRAAAEPATEADTQTSVSNLLPTRAGPGDETQPDAGGTMSMPPPHGRGAAAVAAGAAIPTEATRASRCRAATRSATSATTR